MAYTTAAKVRALLPNVLMADDNLGIVSSGSSLTLSNSAFDVPTILKNTTSLVKDTGFTFIRPDKITLTAAAAGEHYIAQVYIGSDDTDIETIIASVDRILQNEFTNYDTPSSGFLDDWSSLLSAAKYLKMHAYTTEANINKVAALEKSVKGDIANYKMNIPKKSSNIIVKVNR
ncbi:MAG: hypothetical protein MUO31_01010 [Thermodesulfovibrionales bacterium]|nr:hypothetical protein [Thermodesulfovibrionales bacterium]